MSNLSKLSDEWETPQELFDELNEEFNFDIDLCASEENTKCFLYCSDYLVGEVNDCLRTNCAFMNPPYSNPKPFIEKAWEDSKHCKIVCLVKCDPSTRWWATFWDYELNEHYCPDWDCMRIDRSNQLEWRGCCCDKRYNGPKPGCEVRFFPKRIKFTPPKGFEGKVSSSAFPCALLIFDRRGLY